MDGLAQIPGKSVQCVVTSPPYWGLRDYWVDGQIGLEKTPEEYVTKMVRVFREVRRVMKKDGTLWLNMGDSYAAGGHGGHGGHDTDPRRKSSKFNGHKKRDGDKVPKKALPGLKPKDLIGIPWRLAFALQADGWWLRCDIIWAKPNPMPESVRDRPTRAHEYIFLLAKLAKYYYDVNAIREAAKYSPNDPQWKTPDAWDTSKGNGGHGSIHKKGRERGHKRPHDGFNDRWDLMSKEEQQAASANKRSVWTVATKPFADAHFATFPPKLIEPCILAGSRPGDTVLDPFWGSGTTGQVAVENGRKAIGIELNKEYCELSLKRFKQKVINYL